MGTTNLREISCGSQERNRHDRYAMTVYRDQEPGVIVRHLPREIAKACYFFTIHGGQITGEVTGHRLHCDEAGRLEVPCRLKLLAALKK